MFSLNTEQFKWGLKDNLYIFVLLLLSVIFCFDLLFLNKSLFYRDAVLQFYPFNLYSVNSIKDIDIPFWNTYSFCGSPFIANMQSAVFYPFKIFLYLFEFNFGYHLFITFHLFIGGLGMYLLVKSYTSNSEASLLSAVAFGFNTYAVSRIEMLSALSSYVWLPYIIFFFELFINYKKNKYFILASICVFFQILAGHPQIMFYSFIFFIFYGSVKAFYVYLDHRKLYQAVFCLYLFLL